MQLSDAGASAASRSMRRGKFTPRIKDATDSKSRPCRSAPSTPARTTSVGRHGGGRPRGGVRQLHRQASRRLPATGGPSRARVRRWVTSGRPRAQGLGHPDRRLGIFKMSRSNRFLNPDLQEKIMAFQQGLSGINSRRSARRLQQQRRELEHDRLQGGPRVSLRKSMRGVNGAGGRGAGSASARRSARSRSRSRRAHHDDEQPLDVAIRHGFSAWPNRRLGRLHAQRAVRNQKKRLHRHVRGFN